MANPKPKRGPGKPTKYRPEYCELIIHHMADGLSLDAFAAKVGVNIDTIHQWAKVHPEFKEAKKTAFSKNLIYWERMGIEGMTGKVPGFNATVWIFNMKNRFKWRDREDALYFHEGKYVTGETLLNHLVNLHMKKKDEK